MLIKIFLGINDSNTITKIYKNKYAYFIGIFLSFLSANKCDQKEISELLKFLQNKAF